MEKEKNKQMIMRVLFYALIVVVIFSLTSSFFVSELKETFQMESPIEISQEWKQKENDSYTYKISSHDEPQVLYIKTFWEHFEVYLDDTLLFSQKEIELERFSHLIYLPKDCSNKVLSIRSLNMDHTLKSKSIVAYLGNESSILELILVSGFPSLLICLISFILGLAVLFIAVQSRNVLGNNLTFGIFSLGMSVILIGIWMFVDCDLWILFVSNVAVLYNLAYVSFMLLPIFMIYYVKRMLHEANRVFDYFLIAYYINGILFMLQNIFFFNHVNLFLIIHQGLVMLNLVVVIQQLVCELKGYKNIEIKHLLIGFSILLTSCILSIIAFWLVPIPASNYVLIYGIGFVGFFIALVRAALHRIYINFQESMKVDIYRNLAYIDTMTKLGNRYALEEYLKENEIDGCVLCDVNNLKTVNDRYGHQAGDALIIDAATCIKQSFFGIGQCFRYGGDEFVIVLKQSSNSIIQDRIRSVKNQVAQINKTRSFPLELAMGYSLKTKEHQSADELFKLADARMYEDKRIQEQREFM